MLVWQRRLGYWAAFLLEEVGAPHFLPRVTLTTQTQTTTAVTSMPAASRLLSLTQTTMVRMSPLLEGSRGKQLHFPSLWSRRGYVTLSLPPLRRMLRLLARCLLDLRMQLRLCLPLRLQLQTSPRNASLLAAPWGLSVRLFTCRLRRASKTCSCSSRRRLQRLQASSSKSTDSRCHLCRFRRPGRISHHSPLSQLPRRMPHRLPGQPPLRLLRRHNECLVTCALSSHPIASLRPRPACVIWALRLTMLVASRAASVSATPASGRRRAPLWALKLRPRLAASLCFGKPAR